MFVNFSHDEVKTESVYYLRRSDTAINTFELVVVQMAMRIWYVMVQRPIWCRNITASIWFRYGTHAAVQYQYATITPSNDTVLSITIYFLVVNYDIASNTVNPVQCVHNWVDWPQHWMQMIFNALFLFIGWLPSLWVDVSPFSWISCAHSHFSNTADVSQNLFILRIFLQLMLEKSLE